MSDPRFVDRVRWEAQNDATRERASADLDALTQGRREVAVAAAAALLHLDDTDGSVLAATATPTLPKVTFDDLEAFLIGQIELQPASWFVVGTALARNAIRGSPESDRLRAAAGRVERSPAWVYDLFFETCVHEVRELPKDQQEAWLTELERPVVVVDAAPSPAAGRVTVARTPMLWRLDDVFDLWDQGSMAVEVMSSHAPTTLLRALDFNRWFRAVDRWEDGRLVGGALFGDHLLHDRRALLCALRGAADVFDPAGSWTGRTAGVILTQFVLRHAQMLHDETRRAARAYPPEPKAEEALRDLCEVELPAFFTEAWRELLARADGLQIAAALHADLCTVAPDPFRDSGVRALARAALGKQLAVAGVRTADLRELWIRRRRLRVEAGIRAHGSHVSGVNVLVSALEVVEAGGPKDLGLLDLLVERIGEPDPDWKGLAHAKSLSPILDRMLEAVDDPALVLARFCALYEQLERARRRGEYGRTYAENDGELSSLLCLMIVLGVLDEPTVPAPQRDKVLDRAAEWATRMLLTAAPAFEPTLSVERIFAFVVVLAERFSSPRLHATLAVAATDPSLSAWVTAALVCELPLDAVDKVLESVGLTIDSVLGRARRWADVTGRPGDDAAFKELERARASVA